MRSAGITISQKLVLTKDFIKTADNFIILFDASSSMKEKYKGTDMTRVQVAKKLLKNAAARLPDLGDNAGLYLYTPFKAVYPMQPFNRAKFASAVDQLPQAGP